MSEFVNFLQTLWKSYRNSPVFVAAYMSALGAVAPLIKDQLLHGQLDLSRGGLHRIVYCAAIAAGSAVWHLYVTPPGSNPNNQ